MIEAISECVSRREILNNIRLVNFEYSFSYDEAPTENKGEIQITFKDDDLQIKCLVDLLYLKDSVGAGQEQHTCCWTNFKIISSNKEIFGDFTISLENNVVFFGRFHHLSTDITFFLENHALENVKTSLSEESIVLKIQLQYNNDLFQENISTFEQLSESISDFMFVVGDEEVSVNREIFSAQSSVLAVIMDKSPFPKTVLDEDPRIFKLLTSFLISKKFDTPHTEEVLKLMKLANKYRIPLLVKMCAYRLSCALNTDNAPDVLISADAVSSQFLKNCVIKFIKKNINVISKTENYKKLVQHPQLLFDLTIV